MFVDSAIVKVRAGKGGSGIISFRHERYVSLGGPDGGDGGNGGNVVFIASNNQNTLSKFRIKKELAAENGKNGANAKRHGRKGKDLEVLVPVGTQVRTGDSVVVDFTQDGQSEIIAHGGKGGFGNAHFTTSVRQAPRIAEKGDDGEEFEFDLELKIIADVGLIGLPNAGKSTLLASSSAAKPKVANYPFTTLNPHLGVVKVSEGQELLIADIPGLIDGASDGRGLGVEFLRHVERTKVLLHMIDAYSDDIVRDYTVIQTELKNYKVDLTSRPQLVAITKIDGLDQDIVDDQIATLRAAIGPVEVFPISSLSKQGMQTLMYALAQLVEQKAREDAAREDEDKETLPVIGVRDNPEAWHVEVVSDAIVVRGQKIERFAKRTDFESEEAVMRLRDIMHKMGIVNDIEKRLPEAELGMRIYFGDNRSDYMEY